jgi:glycerol uptake facilitator-like aquaporin
VTFVMVWVDRELRSEALGTFLIVLLGDGSVAETVLSGGGGILSIHLGFAVAVTVAYIHLCS